MSIPVIVVGPGKSLGMPVCDALLRSKDFRLVGVITRPVGRTVAGRDPNEFGNALNAVSFGYLVSESKLAQDPLKEEYLKQTVVFFATKADAVENRLAEAFETGFRRFVIGTTGIPDIAQDRINGLPGYGRVVVQAPNFLYEVYAFFELCARAAQLFLGHDVDVEIIEGHHREKLDWPSGTAKKVGNLVAAMLGQEAVEAGRKPDEKKRRPGTVYIHALRLGVVKGDHQVTFGSPYGRLTIAHQVDNRAGFAAGALDAIRWAGMCPLPATGGPYTMVDVYGEMYGLNLLKELGSRSC